jgi:hypothetical protein
MSSEQPTKDSFWPAPGTTVRRGNLTIRNMTGVPTYPATGTHRVVNRCRAGHEETIEVTTQAGLIAAMTAGCRVVTPDGRVCGALVNCSRHVGPDGVGIGMVWIPDERTPPRQPGGAR